MGAWQHDVSSAIAQSIDGIIYIPAVRCHAVDYRDWDYADCWRTKWAPVTQGLILDREMFQYLIFAGSEEVYSKSMTQILSDQYGYSPHSLNSFTVIPPRMLYGHLMIGLKPIIRTNDNLKNSFPGYNTIFWDAELKSVSIQFREEMRPNS